ncbi:MAG TPA: hypothetical protein VFR66_15375 [Burkholderiales bacterium]|nr:hypothetical protein [Burkholderiales bacterium]
MKEHETPEVDAFAAEDLCDRSDRLPIVLLALSLALVLGWVLLGH